MSSRFTLQASLTRHPVAARKEISARSLAVSAASLIRTSSSGENGLRISLGVRSGARLAQGLREISSSFLSQPKKPHQTDRLPSSVEAAIPRSISLEM